MPKRQIFPEFFDENCRRYFLKYLFCQCSKYATITVEGLTSILINDEDLHHCKDKQYSIKLSIQKQVIANISKHELRFFKLR